MAKKSPPRRAASKKTKKKQPPARKPVRRAARPRALPLHEKLREAMEELDVAREELSRLGHAMTAAHRELEDERLSGKSSRENLRAQVEAMRTDLKTALAELEIARADRERIASTAQKRIHELEQALSLVKAEVAELQAAPLPPASAASGGGREEEPS